MVDDTQMTRHFKNNLKKLKKTLDFCPTKVYNIITVKEGEQRRVDGKCQKGD